MTSKSPPQLMGAAEIGRLRGVSHQRVQQLAKTEGFPDTVAVLDMGKVWRADDVTTWAAAHRKDT